jgi:hypothetical protein
MNKAKRKIASSKRRHDVALNPLARRKVVILRCTESEYEELAKNSVKIGSISAYIRECVFGEGLRRG